MSAIEDFLRVEISYQEMYDEILSFINSYDIGHDRLECNEYILKKIDTENFLIFEEYTNSKGLKEIFNSFSISKKKLEEKIENYAKKTLQENGCS